MKSAVVDTNVIVSAALFSDSVPRTVINWLVAFGTILTSPPTEDEIQKVLRRPKLDKVMPFESRWKIWELVLLNRVLIPDPPRIQACRDPLDDKFLELAVAGNATHIITGDQDLLILHPFRTISIVTPADFLAEVGV